MKTVFILFMMLTILPKTSASDFSARVDSLVNASYTSQEMEKANTFKHEDNLTEVEKKVVMLCNLARMDGKKFRKNIVDWYLDYNNTSSSYYTKSLKEDLDELPYRKPLKPEEELQKVASAYAKYSGNKGVVGHERFEERYKEADVKFNYIGENCDYGNDRALDIVMNLLIDSGVKSLGHRKNILTDEYQHIGIAIHEHKEYRHTCVMSFGGVRGGAYVE